MIQVHRGRFGNHLQDFYDTQWNKFDIEQGCPYSELPMNKPMFLNQMLKLSEKLSKDIPQLRVDWYSVDKHLYFGELTFFDGSGFEEFTPNEWDNTLGEWITLPKSSKETT